MDRQTVKERLSDLAEMTERALDRYIPERECLQKNVILAARHSLTAGGKRLRPALVMEFCRVCGGDEQTALPVACAIEMMHTFSLIHDDLPCMDNDDMRRGKPSCHKAFGEANALLAGDALAILPAQIIAQAGLKGTIPQGAALKIIALLGEQAGIYGMIGGQVIDTENEGKRLPENVILEMYRMKTGALLEFCCRAGVIAAGGGAELQLAAGTYAKKLGLAFQIIDDILDITADEKLLGKPVGSDAQSGKFTYAAAVGLDRARAQAAQLTEEAVRALEAFGDREFLTGLTELLLERKY
ncbi:MAG: polyprenyl synthetase family protein [Oscillospiraceae bacterium]|nr:polyprenyl synthetase family protein [Oscillospiraceae bacterium]